MCGIRRSLSVRKKHFSFLLLSLTLTFFSLALAGRIAMTVFVTALFYEFLSGESLLQQLEEGIHSVKDNGVVVVSALGGSMLLTLTSLKDRL